MGFTKVNPCSIPSVGATYSRQEILIIFSVGKIITLAISIEVKINPRHQT
ncbi:MAG: hypothetical protein HWQ38_01240 [Nostoc sp. NMS7]|nr:hypothetical protein [Nostoc sp. NMS7]MBN3945173.1 hypothetical protein [Nostoc sp. NMS7]